MWCGRPRLHIHHLCSQLPSGVVRASSLPLKQKKHASACPPIPPHLCERIHRRTIKRDMQLATLSIQHPSIAHGPDPSRFVRVVFTIQGRCQTHFHECRMKFVNIRIPIPELTWIGTLVNFKPNFAICERNRCVRFPNLEIDSSNLPCGTSKHRQSQRREIQASRRD